MLQIFSHDVYCFLDLDSTLSYVTPYVAVHFDFCPESIFDPFFVSTIVGEPIAARKVYRGCVVFIFQREVLVDLIELDIMGFYVILRMDWFHSCYASQDCKIKKATFHFPNEPVIE